jgi:hypothetical protein
MKSTFENHHFKDSKWSGYKIETFRGARDFFGPLNGTSDSEGHFGAKNISTVMSTLNIPCSLF